jgi:hypothetical protein
MRKMETAMKFSNFLDFLMFDIKNGPSYTGDMMG